MPPSTAVRRCAPRARELACALLLVACAGLPDPETLVPPGATRIGAERAGQLARSWLDRLHGFDALEAYALRKDGRRVVIAVARRWRGDDVQVLIDFILPDALDEVMVRLTHRRDGPDETLAYLPQFGRLLRLPSPRLSYPIPLLEAEIPIGELRPFLRGELVHEIGWEAEVEGEPCWVVVSRPVSRSRFAFDRLELALSRRTGAAVRTRYWRRSRVLQQVSASPLPVESHGGRELPGHRVITSSRVEGPAEIVLLRIERDPELPDALFEDENLVEQLFPEF